MRLTHLFTHTRKEVPKDEVSKNAQLLIRAGFIHKEMAGVYSYLHLGYKVMDKISDIIRKEMNTIGGQEVLMPTLQDKEIWEKSGKWDDEVVDVWFKTKLKNESELGLGFSHEADITTILKEHVKSYKDLPRYIYQIQNKFRNEVRAKSGILRGREFMMKDLYSFSTDEDSLDAFYDQVTEAYFKIFEQVGIKDKTHLTFASGGLFSKFSHEFQAICDAGEDTIYLDEKKNIAVNEEVYTDEVMHILGLDKADLKEYKSIEIGNIFKLGTSYTEPLGLTFVDENGETKPVIMGCYGIGIGRLMGTVAELLSDDKGLVWPESISPYKLHIVAINNDQKVSEFADSVYVKLREMGVEVLYDDREDISTGQKFADADLIGIPLRAVISLNTGNKIEVKRRTDDVLKMLSVEELAHHLQGK